ncbi:RICIN domain-containing protein [Bacillus cereus group sp. N6]|uniref:SdrD B-like domain-containing protein n=1 Tax=Bacillus cereus group sp. N6 TaxID=2794583 RepID=UPI0018F429D4|nr:SdrD B-like domain-containing protein [Bacillus cereus group sp. N6]MBJ8113746.1 RICIN domain-containing protein [Bacillus cereus group sp. N6]
MKKKSTKHSIYCGILSVTLLGSSLPLLATQVHAEEKTKAFGGSVGDLVWEDSNQNGLQDAGEKGIEGITIELYRADGSKVGEQKTDSNGFYQFNALQEGDYFAHIVIPQDQYKMVSTKQFGWDGWTDYFHIKGDGDTKLDADVGLLFQKGKIGETIWEDTNQNGKQDEGEQGVSGVKLELYDIDGKKVQDVTTDEKGHYQFTNIPNGYYYVKLQIPEGYDFLGSPNFGADKLSNYILVEGKQNNEINAGFIKKNKEIAVESIKIAPDKINTTEGQTGTVQASVQPENATNKKLTYESKDTNVVTVDKDGNWKAIKEGTTTITAISLNGKKAGISVAVKKGEVAPTSLSITPNSATYKGINQSLHVRATVSPSNANKTVSYKSSNSSVATIDSSGNIYTRGAGSTTITVRTVNNISKSFTLYVDQISGIHKVTVKHSGKALGAGTEAGTGRNIACQFTSSGSSGQQWEFQKNGSYYTIKNKGTGKYMAGSNIAYEAGTKVVLSNSPDYWKITSIGGNQYTIKHATSGKILDMPMNYLHDGATFQLFNGWSYISTNEAFFIQ